MVFKVKDPQTGQDATVTVKQENHCAKVEIREGNKRAEYKGQEDDSVATVTQTAFDKFQT